MAVLFDLDGVLADSRRPIIDSVNAALAALELPARPEDEVAMIIGPPQDEGFAELLGTAVDDPLVERVVREYRARYATALTATQTFPGMPELLATLSERHLLGVATSKPRRFALPVLEAMGLATHFAYVAGPEPDGPNDKRSMVLEAAKALPGTTAMVGDRRFDIDAAQAEGITAIGVTWGFGSREELAHADHLVDRPEDIAQLV